ncbi:hypothetical protein IG631_14079 [Alternaria alternata]|nr:hypothetical protein IG631_14079 [Alternaria alternata]
MGAPPFADIRLQSATMAANNSDNLKPEPATSHINMGYYYGSDSNNSEAAKNEQVDGESDGDEHIRYLSVGSHSKYTKA